MGSVPPSIVGQTYTFTIFIGNGRLFSQKFSLCNLCPHQYLRYCCRHAPKYNCVVRHRVVYKNISKWNERLGKSSHIPRGSYTNSASEDIHICFTSNSIFDPLSLRFSKIVATWLATVESQVVNS